MKTDVSRQAAATLAAVNAVLDGDIPHWTDPGFLEWETGQVSGNDTEHITIVGVGSVRRWWAYPGPRHDRYGGHEYGTGVQRRAMLGLVDDHPTTCDGPRGAEHCFDLGSMDLTAADYPPPEHTTHGPLLLGPEPPVVGSLCPACMGTGEAMDGGECDGCPGDGRQQAEVAW